jgi:hypothetical protein
MDIMVGTLFIYYAKYGRTFRLPIIYTLFYGLRFMCQAVFAMAPYEGMYWEYPGFPSLVVPYGHTNDFFFSGHIGCCMLVFLEFSRMGWMKIRWLCIATMVCQIILMTITRGHYSIDMITGLFFAHYVHLLTGNYIDPPTERNKC